MTGYGRGTAQRGALKVTVELRSVNHRYLDLKLRTTGVPVAVEEAFTAVLRERLERGALTIAIRIERLGAAAGLHVDRAAARHVHGELVALAAELGLPPPTLREVLAQPGVVTVPDAAHDDDDALAAASTAATAAALDALIAMRTTEGAALARDLTERVAELAATLDQIGDATARASSAAQTRLHDRIAKLCDPGAVDPARLAQEVAILADRADVTEELVRARAHVEQLRAAAWATGPVGRRLDFLTQELGREVNTLGAKSTAPGVASLVVDAKAALEKIREQVQNLE